MGDKNEENLAQREDDIAIVGMAGRFPGAVDIREFWRNLCEGVESIRPLSAEEMIASGVDASALQEPNYVAAGAPLEDADAFDAPFFGVLPREAELMDPQHRIFLECCWTALEDAGYFPERYDGLIGVFGGVARNTYLLQNAETYRDLLNSGAIYEATIGSDKDFPATRVSYKLNLRGPSVSVQSACSTSGVAIHLACQSILNGECDMALAGGARIRVPLKAGYPYVEGGIPSPDGHCRAFDARAAGTVFGSGAAIVVLKGLADALRDGDSIYSVIKGSAINNDGGAKVGYTAPSVEGQASVIEAALDVAEVDAGTISYVEAHGTGTRLGDPIEISALTRAYQQATARKGYCAIGAVKTNIGHLDAGAGAAGVIKASLMLKHRKLVPSLNFETPNPQIDFANSPFFVSTKFQDWQGDAPRRAGVSAFGMGGTNAHMILEEAPPLASSGPSRPWSLVTLSARSPGALEKATDRLLDHLRRSGDLSLSDVAYTLHVGRKGFGERRAVVCSDQADAVQALDERHPRRVLTASSSGKKRSIAMMFPGGGTQYPNMGLGLYQTEAVYRAAIDECVRFVETQLSTRVSHLLYPDSEQLDGTGLELERPSLALPALFMTEYAMARLWMSWGVQPSVMIGHSMGEYTAACLSGVMTLHDALGLVHLRGKLFETLPEGGMMAVPLSEKDVEPLLGEELSFAAINHPALCVVSGPTAALGRLADVFSEREVKCQRLHISVAAHSAMVEPILGEFEEYLKGIELGAPAIPFLSNVTGTWITNAEARDLSYWVRHLRSTVRFADGLGELFADTDRLLIEVGPGQTLSTFARQHPRKAPDQTVVASLRHPKESTPDPAFLLQSLGRLWLSGAEIDWKGFYSGQQRRRVNLPGYPFERKRYWLSRAASTAPTIAQAETSLSTAAEMEETKPSEDPIEEQSMAVSPSPKAPSPDRKITIVERLKGILNELSGLDPDAVDVHATFLELGFESLFLTQAGGAFKKEFGVEITLRQLIEATPSVDSLADYIDERLPPEALAEPAREQDSPRESEVAPSTPAEQVVELIEAANDQSTLRQPRMQSGAAANARSVAESVIARQLEIMAMQLEVLGSGEASALEDVASTPRKARPTASPGRPAEAVAEVGRAASPPTESVRPADQGEARHGPWRPVNRSAGSAFSPRQQSHLDRLIARLNERTAGSKRWTQSRRARLADPRTALGFRLPWKELVYPVVVERSSGSRVWDIDGNEYLDMTMGFGANMLGHSPSYVKQAVEEQLKKGFEIGPQTPLAGDVADLMCELTGMERTAFCNTGSEAVLAAIRVARTVTGRSRIATFSGDYHGIFDEVLGRGITVGGERRTLPVAPGIPQRMVEDVLILDYGDPESLETIREHAADLAAVIVEPVQSRNPDLQPREFLHSLRDLTEREDIPLVFDEMITGFRIHQGGAQAWFGVKADIATYGKAIGGGFPIGAVAGKARYLDALDGGMWDYGDQSVPEVGVTWFAGTFVRHPVAMAAASASLRYMKERGPTLQEELNARVARMVRELNEDCQSVGAPIRIRHFSSFFQITFESHQEFASIFYFHLREKGIHLVEGRAAFLSTAHTDEDMEFFVRVFKESVREMQEGGFLPDPGPGGGHVRDVPALRALEGALAPTESQREILRTCRLGAEASCAYNLIHVLEFKGKVDESALQLALQRLVARHDAIRLVFAEDGETMRLIPHPMPVLPVMDLSGATESEQRVRTEEVLKSETRLPFDLCAGPLFRARVIRLTDDHTILVLTLHHLICDGFSIRTVLRELGALYDAAIRNVEADLPAAMQYTEYARWQEGQKLTEAHRAAEAFWVSRHSRRPAVLELPTDRPRPEVRTFACGEESALIPSEQVESLRQLGARERCTLFSILLTGLNVLLHRLSGQEDVIVGTPASGQSMVESENLVGHCVSLHPFRSILEKGIVLREYLSGVQKLVFENHEHRNYTFGYLLDKLELPDDSTRPPLISVQFNLEPRVTPLEFHGLEVKNAFHRSFHAVDLCFNLAEHDDGMHVKCWFNAELFDPATARGWLGGYVRLVEAMAGNLTRRVEELELGFDCPPVTLDSVPFVKPTDAQMEIWLASQLGPQASCVFNLSYTLRLSGRLDVEALKKAVGLTLDRHEALRARFSPDGQRMELPRHVEIELRWTDLSSLDPDRREDDLTDIINRDMEEPFDLEQGPLVRGQVVKTREDRHELILTFQHIVCDGLSLRVIAGELGAIYTSLCRGVDDGLEPPMRFSEYARRQEERKGDPQFAESQEFWLEQYRELPPALELPADNPRRPGMAHRARCEVLHLDADFSQSVGKCASKNSSTRFAFTLAAFQVFLGRLTAQRDIVVGLPAALAQSGSGNLVGHSVNFLPLRANVDPELPFVDFLKQSSTRIFTAFEHQELTYGALLQKLKFARDPGQAPLLSTVFTLQQGFEQTPFEGLEVEIRPNQKRFGNFDLEFFLSLSAGGLRIECVYNADLFHSETVARWLTLYRNLLAGICASPDTRIRDLPLLDETSRRNLLAGWNPGATDYPRDVPVHRLFEEQVEQGADRIAIVHGSGQLTYRELNSRANRLAHCLRERGVGPGVLVGVCVERSVELVVGVLAILKAGGAYVPLDPELPPRRLAFMMSDTRAPVLLTQSDLLEKLPEPAAKVVCLDTDRKEIEAQSEENLRCGVTATDLAYVIYTSGSTGQPKGTCITHRGVVRLVKNTSYVDLGPDEVFLQFAPISFDASTFELWGSLLNGSKLVVFPPHTPSTVELGEFIEANGITTLWLTAALFAEMVDEEPERLKGVRQLLAGGDVLSVPHVKKVLSARGEGQRLINGYGPTESTTFTCCHVMDRTSEIGRSVPIGKPISNTTVYILDEHLELVPVGVPGELFIGGDGLAREYLNRPDLTAEKFVADPFSDDPRARLYATGDLCRWLEDGNVEFLGRRDHQVKIRGFRVELGEIESSLIEHDSVAQAVAMMCEDRSGDSRLVAYVVPGEGERPNSSELRDHLRQRLPAHAMPAAFVTLDVLPLNPNGKVDRRALPVPDRSRESLDGEYSAPGTWAEEGVATIWSEVLRLDRIGVHDNFFDLGGHSLLAMQLVSRVRESFCVELSLAELFEQPTISGLVEVLESKKRAEQSALVPVSRENELPLSFAQQRLWFLDLLEPENPFYNVAKSVTLTGPLDVPALTRSLRGIVQRHEVLRTTFRSSSESEPVQLISEEHGLELSMVDLRGLAEAERKEEALRLAREEAARSFDLEHGPVLRFTLFRLGDESHQLLLALHHIISDEWSLHVFLEELAAHYKAESSGARPGLPELPIQYADFAVWQREWLRGAELERQLSYWSGQLRGLTTLELATDHPRPARQSFRGAREELLLPAELGEALRALSLGESTTLFMTLLAAFNALLARYTGQEDLVVGSPIVNRGRRELEGLIGLFVNTLVMRTDASGDPSFRELLRRVRRMSLEAYAHQDLPFEKLVEMLQPERDLSRNPLYQVLFVLEGGSRKTWDVPGLAMSFSGAGIETTHLDLEMYVSETDSGVNIKLIYSLDLFEPSTIRRMLRHFQILLEGVSADAGRRVSELPLCGEEEEAELLLGRNDTEVDYPRDVPVHRLFEEQVARTPERLAIEYEEERLSYGELNSRANRLAHYLRSRGVGPEVLVGICMKRSVDLVVGLLGILKAGGAYVPLDPDYPRERVSFILEDAEAPLLLTQSELVDEIPAEHAEIVCVDSNAEIGQSEASNPPLNVSGENLAYAIYTSGSTGRPKGVEILHGALTNFLLSMRSSPGLTEGDVLLAVTTPSFDIAALELYLPLVAGARLVVAGGGVVRDGAELASRLEASGVTVMQATPATWQLLLDSGWKGRAELKMLCGGEALPRQLADRLLQRGGELWNMYGPTETTIWSTISKVERGSGRVSIGRPIANTRVYVLDRHRAPVPVGAIGELYIGGEGLARGYHSRPELTEERFVPDPFSREPGGRLYRTGDQVRYRLDGSLDYLARVDHQVKIRGFRIELGEIEVALLEYPSVDEAVVVARADKPGESYLAAYVVSSGESPVETSEVRAHLMKKLPSYMVPSAIVELTELPLTPNGKVDRGALPRPERAVESRVLACSDESELRLKSIWQELLNVRNVGPEDDFFELGGHSLLAARLFVEIQTAFGKKLPLATLFEAPTIKQLAAIIRSEGWKPRWSSLVAIRSGGTRRPLFLVHGAEGNVLLYRDLALRLDPDQPVFALQYGGLSDSSRCLTRIEDMASSYVEEIKSVQPHGPYYLGGYCLGGTIALEMAHQLRTQGDEVGLVALLETYNVSARNGESSFWSRHVQGVQNVMFHLNNLMILRLREKWPFLRHKLRVEASRLRFPRIGVESRNGGASPLSVRKLNDEAQVAYSPKPYGGRVALFRPKTHFAGLNDSSFGWREVVTGELKICTLPVYPRGLLVEPFVQVLAAKLTDALRECESDPDETCAWLNWDDIAAPEMAEKSVHIGQR